MLTQMDTMGLKMDIAGSNTCLNIFDPYTSILVITWIRINMKYLKNAAAGWEGHRVATLGTEMLFEGASGPQNASFGRLGVCFLRRMTTSGTHRACLEGRVYSE